ncbi:MAG: alpha/beta hydrolase [Candidatus Sumerlaeaceae bacterium]|nr:alpha/beta hydrolase [Candidatus Sumerlaeaceae bacterium]
MELHAQVSRCGRRDARTVVFLHAFPLDSRMWRHQISGLAAAADCLALDTRGFGRSRVPADADFSMTVFATDVRHTLDAHGVRRAVFVGCSMGGYIVLEFLRRFPERVLGLALCNTRAEADSPEARTRRDAMIHQVRHQGTDFLCEFVADNLISEATRAANRELVTELRQWTLEAKPAAIIGALQAMRNRPDSTPDLAAIKVPTLVVSGEQDRVTPPSLMEEMARLIRGSRFLTIPEAGHLAPLENPNPLNDALRSLLLELR